jgi:hypothetical protein
MYATMIYMMYDTMMCIDMMYNIMCYNSATWHILSLVTIIYICMTNTDHLLSVVATLPTVCSIGAAIMLMIVTARATENRTDRVDLNMIHLVFVFPTTQT